MKLTSQPKTKPQGQRRGRTDAASREDAMVPRPGRQLGAGPISPELAMDLQRALGNRAVVSLLADSRVSPAPRGSAKPLVQRARQKQRKRRNEKLDRQRRSAWFLAVKGVSPNRPDQDIWALVDSALATAAPVGAVKTLAAVAALSVQQVQHLLPLHATRDNASLTQLGQAVVAPGGPPAARLVVLAQAVPGLPAASVVAVGGLHGTHNDGFLAALGQALVGSALPVARLVQLAQAVPGLPAADVVALGALHATRNNVYLTQLGQALVAGPLPHGRTLADVVTVVNGAPALQAGDVVPIMQVPALFGLADIGYLSTTLYTGGVTGVHIRDAMGALVPAIGVAQARLLSDMLLGDGINGLQVCEVIEGLRALGMNGAAIQAQVQTMRGTMAAGPTDITAVGGDRKLTATMIHQQVSVKVGPARPVANVPLATAGLARYPTGIDPAGRGEDQLWEDCRTDIALNHPGGAVETAPEQLIRQRLALSRLTTLGGGVVPRIVQQVFQHQEGKRPRAVQGAGAEDALGAAAGAHTVDRHVLGGGGHINTLSDLAQRAAFDYVASCPRRAGAFANLGAAQAGMQAALDAHIGVGNNTPNWRAMRRNVIRQLPAGLPANIVVGGILGSIMSAVHGGGAAGGLYDYFHPNPMHGAAYPAYLGGRGGRQLYAGDPTFGPGMAGRHAAYAGVQYMRYFAGGAWHWSMWNGAYIPYEPGAVLANHNNVPTGAYLRILGGDVTGGWFVHSAWPT